MADPDLRGRADQRFEQALAATNARDPRDFYRDQLRALRERDEGAFHRALDYFETRLVPAVAADDSDPIAEWLEYGRVLAEITSPGRAVRIDATGQARAYDSAARTDDLILHLPSSPREPALVIGLPPQLSPAQRATYDLLVRGSQGG